MEDDGNLNDAPEISVTLESEDESHGAIVPMDDNGGETDERKLADELKRLGQLLADTMRAAASTPEAESLRRELREGAAALRNEIDDTMDATRETTSRVSKEYKSAGVSRLRADLAGALRALNRAVDGLASSVEPPRDETLEDTALVTAATSEADDS